MYVFNNIVIGMAFAAFGVSLPGLINMSSVSITLKRGLRGGVFYSLGAATTIIFQAFIAVAFAGYLAENLEIFTSLRKIAIGIFLILGIAFLYAGLNPKIKEGSKRKGPSFLVGMAVAALNILNIPYYFTSGTVASASKWIDLEFPIGLFFIFGLALGAFLGLVAYAYFAQYISRKATYFVRNLNFFLSGLFFLLAIIQAIQILV